jgi:hypothetical protein
LANGFVGSTLKHLSKEYLKNIQIPIPKNKQYIEDLEPIFQQIETLQRDVQNADKLYKKLIQQLSDEAIPKQTVEPCEPTEPVEIIPEEVKEEPIIRNVKVVKKKKLVVQNAKITNI